MVADVLRELLEDREMTISQLSELADIPYETVKNIYYRRTPDPKTSTMLAIARVFNVSINYLCGEAFISEEEVELLRYYRECGSHGKSAVKLICRYEAGLAKTARKEPGSKRKITLYTPRHSIEDGIFLSDCETEAYKTSDQKAFMAVRIATNNFAPVYYKGDIILLEDRFPESGEIALWSINNVAYIRKFEERPTVWRLISFNRKGKHMEFRRADGTHCIGTVIGVLFNE